MCFAVNQRTTHLLDRLAAEVLARLMVSPMSLDELVSGLDTDVFTQEDIDALRSHVTETLEALRGIELVDVVPC